MEIRSRKVIRRYVSTDGGGFCRRPKLSERDDYYYRRYAQHTRSEDRRPTTYRIVETREPLRPRTGLNRLWTRDTSPIRSEPFKMRMPYSKRVSPKVDYYESRPRGRARSPRPFVVDPAPEIRYAWPKSERRRSPSPEIRYVSPRRRPSPHLSREEKITVVSDEAPREGRSAERPNGPRRPRERTPVVEREPVRRSERPVEIHHSPERRPARSRSSGRRQVRFAEDVDYEEYDRARKRNDYYQLDSDDDSQRRRHFRNRLFPEDVYDRSSYRRLSPERRAYRSADSSPYRRSDALTEGSRLRPRIIQDGSRKFLEAGDRIYGESRRRRRELERDLHDLVSHSSSWRRRASDYRDFSSDDESLTDSRRYRRRWL
ncbi:putative RNA binding protein [Aspergillus stella-maris]|uniref:putative RNA binding protein n=1 Tax=Aspergillus stella-maris TaxID=1810926 RepID=UPI003CCD7884